MEVLQLSDEPRVELSLSSYDKNESILLLHLFNRQTNADITTEVSYVWSTDLLPFQVLY